MTRTHWILTGLIVAELAVGGLLAVGHLRRPPTPPVPDLSAVDPVTADEIRALVALCRTAEQWAGLGEVYLATGFFPEAEACMRQASALDPTNADFAFKHGFILERLGKLEEANARYEAAIRLNHPRGSDCWYYVGKNHLRREEVGPAAAAFERAGSLPGARYELALLSARAGQLAQADAEARRLSEEFPAAYHPAALRYRLALARNDGPAADALADEFARRPRPLPRPYDAEVDWVFGVANGLGQSRLFRDAGREMQVGRAADAETKLRSALAVSWNPDIADRLAEVLLVLRRPLDAADLLTEAVTRAGPSFGRLWRLGQAYDATGQPDRALPMWERAARFATGPQAQGLWHDLATRYDRTGDLKKAKAFHAHAHLATGIDDLDAGRPGPARGALKRAVESDPGLAHAWFCLGEAHRANNQPADAGAAYARCLQIDADHGRARRAQRLLGRIGH